MHTILHILITLIMVIMASSVPSPVAVGGTALEKVSTGEASSQHDRLFCYNRCLEAVEVNVAHC